jgi:pre-rRNA-processing protein TSR1
LVGAADKAVRSASGAVTAKYAIHKKDGVLTLLANSTAFATHYRDTNDQDAAVLAALDLCRVCDLVLFVIDGSGPNSDDKVLGMQVGEDQDKERRRVTQEWDYLISDRADHILSAVKAQGLPTPITVLAKTTPEDETGDDDMTMKSSKSVRRSALKRRQDLKKYVQRFATTEFGGNDKVLEVDLTGGSAEDDIGDDEDIRDCMGITGRSSVSAMIRTLCNISASPPKWVSECPRTYLLAESHTYDDSSEELALTGFLRGKAPWNVNSLIHIPNLGTFGCRGVQKATPPLQTHVRLGHSSVLLSDRTKRESLDMFATPDALMGEQNLVGFNEELEDLEGGENDEEEAAARPAGWSDYQSSWLDAVEDMSMGEGEYDHGELAKELNQKKTSSASTVGGMDMDDDDNDISPEERQALVQQRRKNHQDDLGFPDEVDVPEDINARDRFARYRSLKSFRKSHWDPKESLPESYNSIYHFRSFKATQHDIMAEMKGIIKTADSVQGDFWGASPSATLQKMITGGYQEDDDLLEGCVPSGLYVTVLVEKVPAKAFARISSDGVLAIVGLLPHENKASVVHMGLSQTTGCYQSDKIPVKSKDILTFRCGWRTWKARPVFSQNNLNSDKHKFERFLPQGGAFFASSVFGPVTYAPCPVLVFREGVEVSRELVAVGSVLSADADRIVVKRIILTGFPVRVRKRTAVVKYMFYNPDDVRWFKPAGLMTKQGLNGHIIESVGDHGTMKCLFNAPIKQHDTVCLPLYKRIYPKFANALPTSADAATVKSVIPEDALVVL